MPPRRSILCLPLLAVAALSGGCAGQPVDGRAVLRTLTPETISVTLGGGGVYDRDSEHRGPRNLGLNAAITGTFRVKPATVAKVADTTPPSQR